MRQIGLLGGMSWESTTSYYSLINRQIKQELGGLHSARILLNSVNFSGLEVCLRTGDWDEIARQLSAEALILEKAGADCLLLCTNTMHKVYDQISASLSIPFFHIADTLGAALAQANISKIGLLGTRFTMVEDFYARRLKDNFKIDVVIPDEPDIDIINAVVFDELCLGIVNDASRQAYQEIIERLGSKGAEAVALACTEIEMLIKPDDVELPVFDTTALHAAAATNWALSP